MPIKFLLRIFFPFHIYSNTSVFFSLPLLRDILRYSLCPVCALDFPRFSIGQRSQLILWSVLAARGSRNFHTLVMWKLSFSPKNKSKFIRYTMVNRFGPSMLITQGDSGSSLLKRDGSEQTTSPPCEFVRRRRSKRQGLWLKLLYNIVIYPRRLLAENLKKSRWKQEEQFVSQNTKTVSVLLICIFRRRDGFGLTLCTSYILRVSVGSLNCLCSSCLARVITVVLRYSVVNCSDLFFFL